MTKTKQRQCVGKQRYTRKQAVAEAARRRLFGLYRAYRCRHCTRYHVGHFRPRHPRR